MNCLELLKTIETAKFECADIECGAVFSYGRTCLGSFVAPSYCPTCGGTMDASTEIEIDGVGLIIDMTAEYRSTELLGRFGLTGDQYPALPS